MGGNLQHACEHRFDESVLNRIDSMEVHELEGYSNFVPRDLKHYMSLQMQWLEVGVYFLGINLGYQPSETQIADYILSTKHSKRFRAYYALKFPCPQSN